MYIGILAKQLGLSPKAIRYYESLGLLSEASRSEAGYRVYQPEDVERLRFIQGAKTLGFSLGEIKEILAVWNAGERPCSRVKRVLESKLTELDERIADLTRFRDELRAYKESVDAQPDANDVPCAHVAGATSGAWRPTVPAIDLPLKPRNP